MESGERPVGAFVFVVALFLVLGLTGGRGYAEEGGPEPAAWSDGASSHASPSDVWSADSGAGEGIASLDGEADVWSCRVVGRRPAYRAIPYLLGIMAFVLGVRKKARNKARRRRGRSSDKE